MKKKVMILTAAAAMCMLASCSNNESAQENTTQVEIAADEASEETSEEVSVQEESVSEDLSAQDESAEITDEDVASVEMTFFNKTGEDIVDAKILEDGAAVECGSVDSDGSFKAEIEKDTEELKVEFTIGEDVTRLDIDLEALAGFNVVIESDGADGYKLEYIGSDEEA